MKKLIILTLVALVAIPSSAQLFRRSSGMHYGRDSREFYYGIRLGLNISSSSSDKIRGLDTDSKTGLTLGGAYGFQLSHEAPIWLELAAQYAEKGGKGTREYTRSDKTTGYQNADYRLKYLQVPVVCKYSIELDHFHLQPFLGVFAGLGIAGKTKLEMEHATVSSWDYFNRFDAGLRLGCGMEYQMLYAEAGFDFGLANVSKDDFDTAHSRNFFINVGVNF